MSAAQPVPKYFTYPDRSTTLVLVGAVLVLLGLLCVLMGLMIAAVFVLIPLNPPPGVQPVTPQTMIPPVILSLALAVPLIWLGIGLVRARRWAWTLVVVLSWMWLIVGVAALVMLLFVVAPAMSAPAAQPPNMPREMTMVMQLIIGVFGGCFYVGLPSLFLGLLHRESVRATCLRRDPTVPWTDRSPMPVLAISIAFALYAGLLPFGVAYRWVTPFFGVFLSGSAGAVVILMTAAILAYLAWGMYRLQPAAWWVTLVFGIAETANIVVTLTRKDLMEMYEKMALPPEQLDQMRKLGFGQLMSEWGRWSCVAIAVAWLGYMLFVRRYFVRKPEAPSDES